MGILTNIFFPFKIYNLCHEVTYSPSVLYSVGQSLYDKLKKNELYHHVFIMLEAASLPNSRCSRSVLFEFKSFTEVSHQGTTSEK